MDGMEGKNAGDTGVIHSPLQGSAKTSSVGSAAARATPVPVPMAPRFASFGDAHLAITTSRAASTTSSATAASNDASFRTELNSPAVGSVNSLPNKADDMPKLYDQGYPSEQDASSSSVRGRCLTTKQHPSSSSGFNTALSVQG